MMRNKRVKWTEMKVRMNTCLYEIELAAALFARTANKKQTNFLKWMTITVCILV